MYKSSLHIYFLVITITLGALTSCTGYNKALKSTDTEEKWEFASNALENNECIKALPLLEECVSLTRGTQRAEQVQFKFAEAHFCVRDFYLARYYYHTYAKTFPNSPLVEDVEFKGAVCSYNLSPNWSLDQTETRSAIQEFQLFMDKYPSSAHRDSAQTMIDQLRSKLERKSFESAAIYHKTGQYKSATIALRNALKDYPDSQYRERMHFLIIDSYYQYALLSTDRRKIERFNDATDAFHTFATRFPKSEYYSEAQNIYNHCVKSVETLESQQQLK